MATYSEMKLATEFMALMAKADAIAAVDLNS